MKNNCFVIPKDSITIIVKHIHRVTSVIFYWSFSEQIRIMGLVRHNANDLRLIFPNHKLDTLYQILI